MEVVDPDDLQPIAQVSAAGRAEVDDAVARGLLASRADHRLSHSERFRVLARAADLVAARADLFARVIAREGIKTIAEARREVARAVWTLRLSGRASKGLRPAGDREVDGSLGQDRLRARVVRDPVGVVAAITPFNDPLNLVVHKLGPALAAGNAIIVKPHEATPLSALLLAEAVIEAGLPEGLLSVLPGSADVGEALVGHDDVRLVSFTGGAAIGRRVHRSAGIKRLVLELGGICPTIVFDDADLDEVGPAVVAGAFGAAGQNCLHVQRLLIHHSRYDELTDRLIDLTAQVRLGPKLDAATDMGPLIDEAAIKRVTGLVDDAVAHGASVLCGGEASGRRFAPTLMQDVPPTARVANEEVFGPVTCLERFETPEEALELANNPRGGVHAGIFTSRPDIVRRLVEGLDFGGVVVGGTSDRRSDALPFGGTGRAGLGREGVDAAILAMTEPKTVLTER